MFHLKQRVVRVHRLLFEHIKGGRGEHTGLQRLKHGLLIHNSTPCTIDDVAAASSAIFANVWHGGQPLSVDQMVRFVGQIAVNGHVRAVGKEGVHGLVETRVLCFRNFGGRYGS